MTIARKAVFTLCGLALVTACLWAPWRYRHGIYWINMSYAPVWKPPLIRSTDVLSLAQVDVTRLGLELIAIVATAAVLFALLPRKERNGSRPKQNWRQKRIGDGAAFATFFFGIAAALGCLSSGKWLAFIFSLLATSWAGAWFFAGKGRVTIRVKDGVAACIHKPKEVEVEILHLGFVRLDENPKTYLPVEGQILYGANDPGDEDRN